MNRRSFLKLSIGGISATAAVRTWPFRVYSFPSEIKLAEPGQLVLIEPRHRPRVLRPRRFAEDLAAAVNWTWAAADWAWTPQTSFAASVGGLFSRPSAQGTTLPTNL
jgi:hypothetical protein